METYNTTIIKYKNGCSQIRIYKKPITKGVLKDNDHKPKKDMGYVPWKPYIVEDITEKEDDKDNSLSVLRSCNRSKQKIYSIARANEWDCFITFTFNPKIVERSDYDKVSELLNKWIHKIKQKKAPDLQYILVPELHDDKKNYHFHGLFKNTCDICFYHDGKTYDKHGRKVYNVLDCPLGWTTMTYVDDQQKVSYYITKYVTKDLAQKTMYKKRYWSSKGLDKPEKTDIWIDDENMDEFMKSINEYVQHKKTQQIPMVGQKIDYIEVKDYV